MYRGEFVCRLDSRGRFIIPKPHRQPFYAKDGRRTLLFAAADTLRVYAPQDMPLYLAEMTRMVDFCGRVDIAPLLRLTRESGAAGWSAFGKVAVPPILMRQYGLSPGMELLIVGDSGYFTVTEHKKHPITLPALQEELGARGGVIPELEARQVVNIDLESVALTAPDELRPFRRLESLSLVDCGLTDAGFLTGFERLKHLSLRKNQISSFAPLSALSSLQSLSIAQNPISSLRGVERLKRLHDLAAFDCGIREIPKLPADCQLQSAILDGNRLTGLDFLEETTRLRELRANQNQIRDVRPLAGMQRLQYLHIADNRIEGIGPLLGLPCLRGANINGNPVPREERQMLLVHTLLNTHDLTLRDAPEYEEKRRGFLERYAAEVLDERLPGLLYELIFIRCEKEVIARTDTHYTARARYPLRENRRALDRVLAMPDGWEKRRMLVWTRAQKTVQAPTAIQLEYAMSPGRSGSLRFSFTPGGGIVGPGEPYTIDRSDYVELHVFQGGPSAEVIYRNRKKSD